MDVGACACLKMVCELSAHRWVCPLVSYSGLESTFGMLCWARSDIVRVRNSRGIDHRTVQGGGFGQCVEPLLLVGRPIPHAGPLLPRRWPRTSPVGRHSPCAALFVSPGWCLQGGCHVRDRIYTITCSFSLLYLFLLLLRILRIHISNQLAVLFSCFFSEVMA